MSYISCIIILNRITYKMIITLYRNSLKIIIISKKISSWQIIICRLSQSNLTFHEIYTKIFLFGGHPEINLCDKLTEKYGFNLHLCFEYHKLICCQGTNKILFALKSKQIKHNDMSSNQYSIYIK